MKTIAKRPASVVRGDLTDEQRRAIETRDVSISLSAGAGCGKTFVLTERFLAHLTPGDEGAPLCELDQLVAITFTDRAAREMRERIRSKCYERLANAPAEHGDYWLALLRSLDAARVSTIHAFCASLLRAHAVEAAIDPRFAVLEAAQAQTLLAGLTDDLLRSKLVGRDDDVLDLLVIFGLGALRDRLMDLHSAIRSHDFDEWLSTTPEELVAIWSECHRELVLPKLIRGFASSPDAARALAILRECTFENATMRERQAVLLDVLPRLAESKRLAEDLEAVRANATVQHVHKKHWPDVSLSDEFRDVCKRLRAECDFLGGVLVLDPAAALVSAKAGLALLRLTAEIDDAYNAAKSDQGVLDFDDLLIRTRRLLTDPQHRAVRERLALHTKLLLVDECQDTDPVQVAVVKALCGDDYLRGKLFFVGDYKQSIYRFRGADPSVFRELRAETPPPGKLGLTKNFRSQPAILDFVNALFCDELGRNDDYERLTPNRQQTHAGAAIEFLWALPAMAVAAESDQPDSRADPTRPAGAAEEGKDADSRRRREADWIARRIRQLLDGEHDRDEPPLTIAQKNGPPRSTQSGDIAILFRALSNVQFYEEALRSYGIDYYLVGGHAFYAQQEIFDLLNLLRTLASPGDEISLAGVLRSPFFALADETLFWLAQHGSLSAGFDSQRLPSEISVEQHARVRFARRVISDLRKKKDRLPVAAVINEALSLTGYDAALLGEFLGERKLANLRKLVQQARGLDRGGGNSLSDFIVQLSEFVVRQPKEPLAATQPEATNVVRLMTIHQAKGLEFPVVIVPDFGWIRQERRDAVAFDRHLGPLVRLPREHSQAKALCGFELHQSLCGDEDADEQMRLLYVATTRAADFLILSSSLQNYEKPSGPWIELLSKRFDLESGRLTATLPKDYATPRIRVIRERPATSTEPRSAYLRVNLGNAVDEVETLAASGHVVATPLVANVPADHSARRRFSVSRLSGFVTRQPAAAFERNGIPGDETPPIDALGLGTLVHAVIANLDLKNPAGLRQLVELHAEKQGGATAIERDEALKLVERFVKSPRAGEIVQANQLLVEVEFLLDWPVDGGDAVILQGYLDCLYQDATGHWHVVDYKTNRLLDSKRDELVAAYELQMLVYGLAAEQALGEPAAGLVLHFLQNSSEHVFQWTDAARRRAVELVNQSIDRLRRGEEIATPENVAAG